MICFGLPSTGRVTIVGMRKCFNTTAAISKSAAAVAYHVQALILIVSVRARLYIVGVGLMKIEIWAETLDIYENSKMSGRQMEAGLLYIIVLSQENQRLEKAGSSFVIQLCRKSKSMLYTKRQMTYKNHWMRLEIWNLKHVPMKGEG